ncbi:hypothetical protein FNV43_RR18186 [Rhamnella rubrinervis]|uniref:Reverse transcriptase zinc-binding domain-containing protein n=1 Tax=Rhamnella rubrinervis TaxID=2594499 RepID=A0A8K0E4P6_9ROSA|nr:hypothetical protein FNV43_RR18186 [Rhamnella rubrinervis]
MHARSLRPDVAGCILSAKEVVKKEACFRVRKGTDIKIWTDPWVPGLPNKIPQRKEGVRASVTTVAELMDLDTRWWKVNLVREVLEGNSADEVLKITMPNYEGRDKNFWIGDPSGVFSVKSAYMVDKGYSRLDGCNGLWKDLWKMKIHERLKMFMWRVLSGCLPTRARLATMLRLNDASYVLCGNGVESTAHLFCHCNVIRAVVFGSKWSLKWDTIVVNGMESLLEFCVKPEKLAVLGDRRETSLILIVAMYRI